MATLRKSWILQTKVEQYDVIIMSNYDIVSINLCQEVGNDELTILTVYLCGRIMWSVFDHFPSDRRSPEAKTSPVWMD